MSKRAPKQQSTIDDADVPVVAPREPCPCGSGRRYKACHGRTAARAETALVARPFEGLAAECDLIAMAILVPSASSPLKLADGTEATVVTLLPVAWPALHRADGQILLGMQIQGGSGDASRDAAAALLAATELPAGSPVLDAGRPGPGPRLQDILAVDEPLDVTVHEDFAYWLDGVDVEDNPGIAESLERANEAIVPTVRLSSVVAAYWCRIGTKEHLRWVLPEDEEKLLDAFARLQVKGELGLGPGTRYIGSFRSHGLLVAVWDLAPGDEADDVEDAASELRERLTKTLAEPRDLTNEERRVRDGLTGRQITLR